MHSTPLDLSLRSLWMSSLNFFAVSWWLAVVMVSLHPLRHRLDGPGNLSWESKGNHCRDRCLQPRRQTRSIWFAAEFGERNRNSCLFTSFSPTTLLIQIVHLFADRAGCYFFLDRANVPKGGFESGLGGEQLHGVCLHGCHRSRKRLVLERVQWFDSASDHSR